MKLYLVRCRGMKDSHGTAYALASDPSKAYALVRASLDQGDLGFAPDRELDSITQLADEREFMVAGPRIYVSREESR